MRHIWQFILDLGRWGVASDLAASVFFSISFYEHFHGKSLPSFVFMVAAVTLFTTGGYAAWDTKRKDLEAEIAKNGIAPEIDLDVRGLFFREKNIGKSPTSVFVHMSMTLKNPSEVLINSFDLISVRAAMRNVGTLVRDLQKWMWARKHPEKVYETELLIALPSDLRQRGGPNVGWLHFEINLTESELIKSTLLFKVSSKHGTCTKQIDGAYGSSVGAIEEKGRIFEAESLHVWAGTNFKLRPQT